MYIWLWCRNWIILVNRHQTTVRDVDIGTPTVLRAFLHYIYQDGRNCLRAEEAEKFREILITYIYCFS